MLWALVFVTVTAGFVVSQMVFMAARRGERDARYNRAELADTFARSGLQDAVGWFHGRSNQPITEFAPMLAPDADPPVRETIDPALGLVREFEINGNLWGRYEVRKDEVADISAERGDLVPGSAWQLGVRAFVYRKRDADKAYNQEPNQLVGSKALTSEIRWLQIHTPAPAAVCAADPSQVTLGSHAVVVGATGSAIAYADPAAMATPPPSDQPAIDASAQVSGMPYLLPVGGYDASPEHMFAMRLDELRTYSDALIDADIGATGWSWDRFIQFLLSLFSGGGGAVDAAPSVPTIVGKLVLAKGLQLDGELVLQNSLLVVDGNLTTTALQRTRIDGVVYVTGDALLERGTFELNGALVVGGRVRLGTGFSGTTTIRYDASRIESLRQTVGKYRMQRGRSPAQ